MQNVSELSGLKKSFWLQAAARKPYPRATTARIATGELPQSFAGEIYEGPWAAEAICRGILLPSGNYVDLFRSDIFARRAEIPHVIGEDHVRDTAFQASRAGTAAEGMQSS